MNRNEHLEWAKARARAYADDGDVQSALASITSDLNKHPDLGRHPAIPRGVGLVLMGALSTKQDMDAFLDGIT